MDTMTSTDKTTDEYQASLYRQTLSIVPDERFAAAREAIATSPYTWEDLGGDGVQDLIETAIEDDAILNRALAEVGELDGDEQSLLGKFTAEAVNEIIVEAEATFWLASYCAGKRQGPAADQDLAYDRNDPKHPANQGLMAA